ncbi:hypothetical protein EVA_22741, partial [gut metagenome]
PKHGGANLKVMVSPVKSGRV